MALAEEISRQPSIDSVMWLLVVTLMQIYNEEEQAEKEKCKIYAKICFNIIFIINKIC